MLARAAWRHFLRHPVQLVLSFAGVAFGVALMTAVDLTNRTAVAAFDEAASILGGKATHAVRPADGRWMEDSLYIALVKRGISGLAPVVEWKGEHPELGSVTFFGMDPFADGKVRRFSNLAGNSGNLADFLFEQRRFFADSAWAQENGWAPGDTVRLGKAMGDWIFSGSLVSQTAFERKVLRGYLVADIQAVQQQFGLKQKLSRIDIAGAETANLLRSKLPEGVFLQESSEWQASGRQMSAAFRLNLSALSRLGLLVAVLLVFQTASFSVIQRRNVFVRLVVLGLSSRELLRMVLAEALAVGLVASFTGALAGSLAAGLLLPLVSGTLTDFFNAPGAVTFNPDATTLARAVAAGVFASLAGAFLPALQASRTTIRQKEEPLYDPAREKKQVLLTTLGGLLLTVSGAYFLFFHKPGLFLAYLLLLMAVAGWLLLLPLLRDLGARLVRKTRSTRPGLVLLAARSVFLLPGGVWSAAGAISLALGMFLGVTVMVNSFRFTVETWLGQVLRADVYISADGFKLTGDRRAIPEAMLAELRQLPVVKGISLIENRDGRANGREIGVQLISVAPGVQPSQVVRNALPDWQNLYKNGSHVLVSEPLSNALNLRAGDSLVVETGALRIPSPIAAVYVDFASVKGSVSMARSRIPEADLPPRPDGATVYLNEGASVSPIQKLADEYPSVTISTGTGLLEQSLAIFDRTFMITAVLRYLIGGIAVLGVAGALFSRVLSHLRDLGRMEAIGFSRMQLAAQTMLEALGFGLLGLIGAIPAGLGFARVLVDVINPVSFGWSLVWRLTVADIAVTAALGLGAVLVAGLLPVLVFLKRPLLSNLEEES